jgi:hypothetical protein
MIRHISAAFGAALCLLPAALSAQQLSKSFDSHGPVVIEKKREGKPRAGQVVVAIQPPSDDIPIFAAGLYAKLIDEGATPYMIRVTNDDMAGPGNYAETVMANKRDQDALDRVFGIKKTYELTYNNHMMDNIARSELRQRFIFLFRLLYIPINIPLNNTNKCKQNRKIGRAHV